jgi:hypothetical protein
MAGIDNRWMQILKTLVPACVIAASGCTVKTDSTMHLVLDPPRPAEQTGIRIGDETLKQFRAGETKEAWILAVIGTPTSSQDVAGEADTHVLRYSTVETSSGIGSLLTGSPSRNSATVYFVIKDGILQKFWADRDTERTLLGREVEKKTGEKQGP